MINPSVPAPGTYRPGTCNIGPAEIERRRRSALAATLVTVIVAAAILLAGLPPISRLSLWPFATASAVAWLQVTRRFCVAFGAAGIRNFGRLGETTGVEDAAARAADRRTAARMILEGAAIGAVATMAFWLLPA